MKAVPILLLLVLGVVVLFQSAAAGSPPGAKFDSDPDLKPGFPISFTKGPGAKTGQSNQILVANIDADPEPEIMLAGLGDPPPVYAWNYDGTIVSGFPVSLTGSTFMAIGELNPHNAGPEVAVGYGAGADAFTVLGGDGTPQTGFPIHISNYISAPPALADLNKDGVDEIFLDQEDGQLHAYNADGSRVTGWPAGGGGG